MSGNVRPMEPRITLVTLAVSDLEASLNFYQGGLGLPLVDRESGSNIAFFDMHGFRLALYPSELLAKDACVKHDRGEFSGVTLSHNVKSKKRVDSLMGRAEMAGAKVIKVPEDTFWGGYSGYFSDLDGHLWEIAWNPHFWVE